MGKKKKEEGGAPGWIVTFADLMSLLLTFFVLLLSFAETDVKKFKETVGSIKDAFGVQSADLLSRAPTSMNLFNHSYSEGSQSWLDNTANLLKPSVDFDDFCEIEKARIRRNKERLRVISNDLEESLKDTDFGKNIQVQMTEEGFRVAFKYLDYFNKNSVSWKRGAWDNIIQIIEFTGEYDLSLVLNVSGLSPESLRESDMANWRLSALRKLKVFEEIKKYDFDHIDKVLLSDQPTTDTKNIWRHFYLDITVSESID